MSARTKLKLALEASCKEGGGGVEEHVLVLFDNGEYCSVPVTKILETEVSVHQECTVKWHTGKKYKGRVLLIGTYKEVTEEVERLCDDEGKEQERGQADVKEGKQQDAEGEWIGKNVEGERKKADDVKERKQQDAKGIGEDVKGERKKAEGEGKDAEGVKVKKRKRKLVPSKSQLSQKAMQSPKKKGTKKKTNQSKKAKSTKSKGDDFPIELGSPATSDDESSEDLENTDLSSIKSSNRIVLCSEEMSRDVMTEIKTLHLGLKQLSETVNTLLNKQDISTKVADPIYSAGHYPPYYQHHMLPYYGYNPCPPLPPPPPPPPPPPVVISPTQSSSSDTDLSFQRSTITSSTDSNVCTQLDSDVEDVPPLPPPLPILKDYKGKDELEDVRSPLQPMQAGGKKRKTQKTNDIYPVTEVFNSNFLSKCLAESVSRPNFSLNLVNKFFTEEVRLTSNVSGKGKNQFDKDILAAIKVASFRMWPLKSTENEVAAWRDCVKAIDEGGRRLRKRLNTAAMKLALEQSDTVEQSDTKEN